EKSLVIMDEVGRGTGTNDGLSIAWAVSEELLYRVGCRTLFATHFHELSLLSHPRLANRSMEVLDKDDKIVFLRKLKEGPAAESYGIHVAKLAGLAESVLQRASQIMEVLRERDIETAENSFFQQNSAKRAAKAVDIVNRNDLQVNKDKSIIDKLLNETDPEQMTPFEALNLLNQWKKLIQSGGDFSVEKKAKKPPVRDENSSPSLFDSY
ncbi:MAG: DNA mismatch repair protein MutS, partial [Treponema sp.]|nr:DNA mismatch repair protein MutS [Treponema sp.]